MFKMKITKITNKIIITSLSTLLLLSNCNFLFAQTRIRELPENTSPVSADMFPMASASGGTYRVRLDSLLSTVVPKSRLITCVSPLLCDGSTSMTLDANRTLSLQGPSQRTWNVTCVGSDTSAINTALSAIQSAGGGILHLSGSCVRSGDIVNNPVNGVTSHLIIEGDGRSSTVLTFTSCSSNCIYLGSQSPMGSGHNDGSGIRNLTVVAPTTKDAIVLANLEKFLVRDIYVYGGLSALTVSESRSGTISSSVMAAWTGNGIKIIGESFASNMFSDLILVAGGTATGSGVIYAKTTASGIDGIYFRDIVVNGTTTGPAYSFSTVSLLPLYGWFNDCVADGAFSSGFSFTNFSDIYMTQPWSIAHGSGAVGMKFDNTDNVSIVGGELWAGDGGGSADLSLLNSVTKFNLDNAALSGGVTAIKVDSTTHDASILPRYVTGATWSNDASKIAPLASTQKTNISFSGLNGSLACSQTSALTGDVTTSAGSCSSTLSSSYKGWTDGGTTVSTATSTDKVGIGTSSPDSLLTISANVSALPSTLTGTLLHLGNADGTVPRIGFHAFATNGSIDFIRGDNTAASPTAISGSEVIGQLAGFGYDGTSWVTVGRVNIQLRADGTWSNSSSPTSLTFGTTLSGQTALRTVLTLDNSGHAIFSDSTSPSVSCTGTGTSPASPTLVGTDNNFIVTINTGTGTPGSTGTCTVTFAHGTYSNAPVMVCMPVKGATAWGNGATLQLTTESTTAPVLTWTNLVGGTATALTVSTSYKFSCINMGRL